MRHRIVRAVGWSLLGLLLGCVGAAGVVQTGWFKNWLRQQAVTRVSRAIEGELSIGRLSGSLVGDVTLNDVVLRQADGRPIATIGTASVAYRWWMLVSGPIVLDWLSLRDVTVDLVQTSAGWNINRILPPSHGGGGRAFALRRFELANGDITIEPEHARAEHLTLVEAGGRVSIAPGRAEIGIDSFAAHDASRQITIQTARAAVRHGPAGLAVHATLDTSAGELSLQLAGRTEGAVPALEGEATFSRLDLATLLQRPGLASALQGQAHLRIALPSAATPAAIRFQVTSPHVAVAGYEARAIDARGRYAAGAVRFDGRARAYGSNITMSGSWGTSATATPGLAMSGSFAALDLRHLPETLSLPPLASDLRGRYSLRMPAAGGWSADVTLGRSSVEGATVAAGTVGHASEHDATFAYSAAGHVEHLDVQRLAGPLDVSILHESRFRSDVTGSFEVSGRGGGATARRVTASARLGGSTVAATQFPALEAGLILDGPRLEVSARGPFVHLTDALAGVDGPSMDSMVPSTPTWSSPISSTRRASTGSPVVAGSSSPGRASPAFPSACSTSPRRATGPPSTCRTSRFRASTSRAARTAGWRSMTAARRT